MKNEFGFIATNTSRSRAYINAISNAGLRPIWTLLLDVDGLTEHVPGQATRESPTFVEDLEWPELAFDPSEPIKKCLERNGFCYTCANSRDINDPAVVKLISQCPAKVVVYSGYGGVLLRKAVLSTGKDFLHVHGGYIPEFKGSTTNYYSLIADNSLGASAIFLTAEIDSGPLLARRKFRPPKRKDLLDHGYDSAVRARVLVEVLQKLSEFANAPIGLDKLKEKSQLYYVIHPVLKHIAIMSEDQ